MKIIRVESIPLRLPFASPFKISQGEAREMLDVLIVRIHTDDGLIGVGETQAWRRQGSAETLVDPSSRVRWIAPDLDAIPVGIPEIDRLPIPTGSPSPTPFLDRHPVLGEMLVKRLEVGSLHNHGEMVQVLEAWATSQRFPWLHGKEVDHGVRADTHGGKWDLSPAELVEPLRLKAQDVHVKGERAVDVRYVEHDVVHW